MPAGYHYAYANDTSDFIKLSVEEVVKTLIEAIVLVVLVIFVFLQSWRATLIPFIAVPVVLLGTFAILYALGFSINTMTLFGLVLATGLLVDDAIVVVENVERLLHENPDMTPREATIESMEQIQMALIAHRPGPVGGVPADGLLRRIDRGHLPPVLGDDRLGDGAVDLHRVDAEPGDRRQLARRKHATVEETWLGRWRPRSRMPWNAAAASSTTGFDRWSTGTSARSAGSSTANGCSSRFTPACARC